MGNGERFSSQQSFVKLRKMRQERKLKFVKGRKGSLQ